MASLHLKNVHKKYPGEVQAVSDFNLDIADKEFLILVGPSGCGKTTTLRMIAGLEEITEGEVFIENQLVNKVEPKDRDIAMVFQNYALYPHMSVFKNMAFGLQLRKIPRDEIKQRVHETAKILEIEHLLDRKPKELSGGQKQRVALGRAIVRRPKVFLMDEPLSNLDARLRVQMRTEISKLHQKLKTTIIYVTHDQIEAMTMGTRIVVMKDGCIQQVDTPKKIYDNPHNMFVAGFIGSPQMNFIKVEVEKQDNEVCLVFDNNRIKLPKEKVNRLKNADLAEKAVMGIRPEDIHVVDKDIQSTKFGLSRAEIEIVEILGAEAYVHMLVSDINLVAKINSKANLNPSDIIKIDFDIDKIHLFDQETETSLLD